MRTMILLVLISTFTSAFAANSYIEFGQFDKVKNASIASGALYACSKDDVKTWEQRLAFQFMHFKIEQVVDAYFLLAYRVTATQDVPLAVRTSIVDEHKKIEALREGLQQGGYDAIGAELTCDDAAGLAREIMSYQ